MPERRPGIQGQQSPEQAALDRRVKPGDDVSRMSGCSNIVILTGARLLAECGKSFSWKEELSIETVCGACGVMAMRPNVVWFGEMAREMEHIYDALGACDLFISIGSSDTVSDFVLECRAALCHDVALRTEAVDPDLKLHG
jgi:NAD-dependent deacetylase